MRVGAIALLIVQDGMPMKEGAARAVLSREAHCEAILQERGVRQCLCTTPVKRSLACNHPHAIRHYLRDPRLQGKSFRHVHDTLSERTQTTHLNGGLHALGPV